MVRFISLFSGVGGFDLGFECAGMECVAQVEIDARCREVLAQHWPYVTRYEDVREVRFGRGTVDLICGGFPCQDLSVAGRRAGLAGERSGLWHEFRRILDETRPTWAVIENVPGLLSSNGGRDFAVVLRGLVELGYGVTWRILDAQYYGVAQRRRRVFVVGHLGDGRAAQVLFEQYSRRWDSAPSREKGTGVTFALTRGLGTGGADAARAQAGWLVGGAYRMTAFGEYADDDTASALKQRDHKDATDLVAYTIQTNDGGAHRRKDRPDGGMYVNDTDTALTVGSTDLAAICFDPRYYSDRERMGGKTSEIAGPLKQSDYLGGDAQQVVVFTQNQCEELRDLGDVAGTLSAQPGTHQRNYVAGAGIRRLTPVECCRLQGFPDNWNEGQSDSTRYKQMGNAVCVPVAEWIGRRIMAACRMIVTEGR